MRYDSAKMPAAEIKIRRMDHADILAIVAIEQSVHGAPHWPRSLYEEALLVGSPQPRLALVANGTDTGEIAGFIIASLIAPEAELESIAVAEIAQRRGVGRRLLQALAVELHEQGIAELHLEVRASNLPAIRFYESQNFKQIGVRPRYYSDPEEDAVLMTFRLA
jgi:ribosomal-protein-alanine N-acetyltransferase